MRIEYNGTVISAGDFFENVIGFELVVTPIIQRTQPMRAPAPRFIDRGCKSERATFTVAKFHASIAASEAYAWKHREAMSAVGPCKITGIEGAVKEAFWTTAALNASSATFKGRTTFIKYEIEAGAITKDKPR